MTFFVLCQAQKLSELLGSGDKRIAVANAGVQTSVTGASITTVSTALSEINIDTIYNSIVVKY